MRLRLGLLIAAVFANLLSPLSPTAFAFGGLASAPLNVTSTAIAGGLRVTWTTPTDVDTGITGYKIESSTAGTSGTWGAAITVSSSTFTYDIIGLSQSGTYVRVAATTSAGTGTYGYPWTKLYSTIQRQRNSDNTIQYESGFGLGGSDPYTTLQSSAFTRVRYLFNTTLTSGGTTNYADVDFYKWANPGNTAQTTNATANATIRNLSIPTVVGLSHVVQANVTDMNVFSDHSNVTDTRGINGRLELWGLDYSHGGNSGLTPAGSSGNYDYDDSTNPGTFGSFQVHNLSTLQPVFVWNHHTYLSNADLNYGINTTSGAQPDSTFCGDKNGNGTCPDMSAFKLQIFANIPVTPLADTTPPTVSRGDARTVIKSGETISVRSTEIGTAYLVRNTVSVTSVASITAAGASDRNSLSISAVNTSTTLTTSGLQDGIYNLYAADSFGNLSTGLLATVRVDTTPPVATAFSVNSAGNAILMTIGETATQSSFNATAFSVSDSGSAISVTSASISGLVITLNLSRVIPAGASVTFAYTLTGIPNAERWSDAAGNQLAAVTSRVITNNSASQISVNLVVADPLSKGSSTTLSVSVSVVGRVTFTIAGKRIPGCLNKIAIGATPVTVTCTFKPAVTARQTISATLTPTLGAYPVTVASVERFVLKRSALR